MFRHTHMKTNNVDLFENVYNVESDAIFRFCLIRVSGREQALDITQETFLRYWQSLVKGEKVRNDKAFLFTIAHRLIIDWYRKKKSFSLEQMMHKDDEKDEVDILDVTSLDSIDVKAEGRFLLEKINQLPVSLQHPVYLRFVEGLSPPEIGDILNISSNSASVRINRGISELRKITGYDKN